MPEALGPPSMPQNHLYPGGAPPSGPLGLKAAGTWPYTPIPG